MSKDFSPSIGGLGQSDADGSEPGLSSLILWERLSRHYESVVQAGGTGEITDVEQLLSEIMIEMLVMDERIPFTIEAYQSDVTVGVVPPVGVKFSWQTTHSMGSILFRENDESSWIASKMFGMTRLQAEELNRRVDAVMDLMTKFRQAEESEG